MSPGETADYCLDCHWEETFDDIMGKLPMLPPGSWQCDDVHPTTDPPCGVEDGYCANDTCSLNCSSVCDGFVDCDLVSTVCSNANCEEALCESTASACFDTHCCEQGQNEGNNNNNHNNITTGLLRQHGFQWEPALFLPAMAEPQTDMSFNESQMINHSAAVRCHHNCNVDNTVSDSQCHNPACDFVFTGQMYPHDCGNPWISTLPSNSMAPSNVDANVMMNNATFDAPLQYSNSARFNPEGNPIKMPCFQAEGQQSCANEGFQHLGCYLRNSGDTRLVEFSKQQSQSRVHRHFHGQAHHHELTHHTAPHNIRKNVSSPTISSFIDSPPSLDRTISSALTSPTPPLKEETTANAHVCRWNCGKSTCNASFSCCGDLQQHLVTHHMQPIDGSKGHGYYCCWEGCHRPHEPFSQKSKLQGHFLTHSNYKNYTCSVCGKAFARQATLERHERSHRGEKPFKCKECGKAFTDSSELKTHSRTHTGEKPFKCTFPGCDFQTGDSSNMSSHKLTHVGRRHKCSYRGCGKSFTRADQLKRHLKSTHKQDNQSRSLLSSKPKLNSITTVS